MGKLKLLLTLFIVLVVTSMVNQTVVKNNTTENKPKEEVASEKITPTPTNTPTPTSIPPKESEMQVEAPKPTSTPQQLNYVYPGATIVSSGNGTLVLSSTDDPGKITYWYVGQIQNSGFNAKSTVRTNTNGNVLNKISASGENIKVQIEIKKSPNSTTSEITLSF